VRELDRIAATVCAQTLNMTQADDLRQAAYDLLNNRGNIHQMAQRILRDHPEFQKQVDIDTAVRITEVALEQQLVQSAFGSSTA